jgi:hypothetical protein
MPLHHTLVRVDDVLRQQLQPSPPYEPSVPPRCASLGTLTLSLNLTVSRCVVRSGILRSAAEPVASRDRFLGASNTGGEQQSVATAQALRGWARPPCRHFKIQSCDRAATFLPPALTVRGVWVVRVPPQAVASTVATGPPTHPAATAAAAAAHPTVSSRRRRASSSSDTLPSAPRTGDRLDDGSHLLFSSWTRTRVNEDEETT